MNATPSLVIDPAVLQRTIDAMAALVGGQGLDLRPHVKTHKCLEIARLQRDAGARGITVATLGEAEVFAAAGFDDITVAYPVWVDEKSGARLRCLREQASVRVGVDSVDGARQIARHCPAAQVLVEIDSGHHRTGAGPAEAGAVAAAANQAGLEVAGVFTFPGHSYSPETRAQVAAAEQDALSAAVGSLSAQGIASPVVSGGSSPSAQFVRSGVLTELRPGAYVFNDAQQWELGACTAGDIALTVHATVVSHAGGRLVLDAGSKALAADRPAWASGSGRLLDHPDARIVMLSEHHAVCELDGPLPPLGSTVRVVPNHCCNAVALADEFVVGNWDGERLDEVDRWQVAARNRNH